MSSGEQWQKILWKEQPYPDNYIPPHAFLSSLRRNPNFKPYTYWPLVFASLPVAQQLAVNFIFLAVFVRVHTGLLDPRVLVWISIGCFLVGYGIWETFYWGVHGGPPRVARMTKAIKSSILVFLTLLAVSPVLRTLTAATSSDSIWALSACLFILHILLGDYTPAFIGNKRGERLISVLSMNAAISASVVLASRLQSDLAVFGLTLYAVQAFALFPILRRRIQTVHVSLQILLTVLLYSTCICMTASLSKTVSYLYMAILSAIIFVAPGVLLWAQRYKNEIRGPWDVAVPKVN